MKVASVGIQFKVRPDSVANATTLFPSGVSSAYEAQYAAFTRSASSTPSTGMNAAACLFPRVIVPVLSRRRTFTSPAASMALPDMAMMFLWNSRSMPAIPMAGRRAAMVVGARQTKSAINTVRGTGLPLPEVAALYADTGQIAATTRKKTPVRANSRISSACSFGVFRRFAPSII